MANTILITAVGSGSYVKPINVTTLVVECWGAGGAGAGNGPTDRTLTRWGGAGGAYARSTIACNLGTQTYNVIVGAGGIGVQGAGPNGGPTIFNDSQVYAEGGAGGLRSNTGSTTGSSANSIGDVVYRGGNPAGNNGAGNHAGGGGAGSTGNGGDGLNTGGLGTSEYGGNGGSNTLAPQDGNSGSLYGGGGGSMTSWAGNWNGGNGAQGLIRITEFVIPSRITQDSTTGKPVRIGPTEHNSFIFIPN